MKQKPVLLALTIAILTAAAHGDDFDSDYLWDHPDEVRVSMDSLAFGDDKYGPAKNESIFIMSFFNDGWVLMYSLFHIDHKFFDRWGMYALIADPSGRAYWKTLIVKAKNIELGENQLSFTDGTNRIEGKDGTYRLVADFDGFSCDLVFSGYLPAWKPGTGQEHYTEDGKHFQYKAVFLPWAQTSGSLSVDNRTVSVVGHGYGEKSLFVNPFTRHQPNLHALRLYTPFETPRDEGFHFGLHEPTLNKAYDYRKLPRLVGIRGSSWLFTTRDYVFEPIETATPDYAAYGYPTRFRLSADANGYILDGIVSESVFFHYTDVLESLPRWIRSILLVFFNRPVYFRYVAEFVGTLTMPDGAVGELHLRGPYEYVMSQ